MSPPMQETTLQFDVCYNSSIDAGIGREDSFFLHLSHKSVCNAVINVKSECLEET